MVAVKRLLAPMAIPSSPNELSVMTYNVLLPNSVDGWWNYKMYLPPIGCSSSSDDDDNNISAWPHRSHLLKERIGMVNADVVCIQEVSPESFEKDFAFMKDELGYDGVELFKKGRFRPATFWKTSRCDLVCPPVHKDRTLLTAFQLQSTEEQSTIDQSKTWYVLNCHLQAGGQAARRLRQINEGVTAVVKLGRKLKEKDPTNPRLVVCGDFNGGSECAAVRYLEDGLIDDTFVEDGDTVTSKAKKIPLDQVMIDVASLENELGRPAPPTLVVPELISLMVGPNTNPFETSTMSTELIERLTRAYHRYATSTTMDDDNNNNNTPIMTVKDVETWLIDINGLVGRGSEFRKAAKEMGWTEPVVEEKDEKKDGEDSTVAVVTKTAKPRIVLPQDGILTLQGFLNVYEDELKQGKFWGIAHDLAVMNEPLPDKGVFEGRFDRMYCSSSIYPTAVLDTISNIPCPNANEPSDHLPVVASFRPSTQ